MSKKLKKERKKIQKQKKIIINESANEYDYQAHDNTNNNKLKLMAC